MANYASDDVNYYKGGGIISGNGSLPVETAFRLPAPTPSWPPGDGFAKGSINLGRGLEVCQVSSFAKVWAAHDGGPGGLGATFFMPFPVPSGFSVLGCYAQPNNKPLFGWVLAGRDVDGGGALRRPLDYTLLWSSTLNYSRINNKVDGDAYFWVPTPPQGYRAVGLLVTSSPEKPSPEDIRCVRADLTDVCENEGWVWGDVGSGFNVCGLRPVARGTRAAGVSVGTCTAQQGTSWCLKNNAPAAFVMPNKSQIEALMHAYSPVVYFHPDEPFMPSSVGWFFDNGALLYKQDDPRPAPIDSTGSNLPMGGSDDGAFWLDLPADDGSAKDRVKKGHLPSSEAYVHVKPMLGGTFTDLAVWVFYPFNGPARAKVEFVDIPFDRIGEHVGDWEHVTLRVSNLTGELWRVYFAEHSSGAWVDASQVEFQQGGGNKPVAYSSLHGHAAYAKPGLVLQGDPKLGIGIRNDTARGGSRLDTGARYQLVAADYLDSTVLPAGPPWIDYLREWGPKVSYDIAEELRKVEKLLPPPLRKQLEKVLSSLPAEALGEEGPTGPKEKGNWAGDEVDG